MDTRTGPIMLEPADKTRLVIETAAGGMQLIHRDDGHALKWEAEPGQHWYAWDLEAPHYWDDLTRGAARVYALVPIASDCED